MVSFEGTSKAAVGDYFGNSFGSEWVLNPRAAFPLVLRFPSVTWALHVVTVRRRREEDVSIPVIELGNKPRDQT